MPVQTIGLAAGIPSAEPPAQMTYEQFLDWADEDTWAEWVNGKVIVMSPASDRHQSLVGFLAAILRHFAEANELGIVRSAPFQMKTGPELPGREPDVLFLSNEHLDRIQQTYVEGPADLVIEVISPDSRARDRGDKYYEYEQGGVQEYWLIDPLRKRGEFYVLGDDGIYQPSALESGHIFRSTVLPGCWIDTGWLWQERPPYLMSILKAWGLV